MPALRLVGIEPIRDRDAAIPFPGRSAPAARFGRADTAGPRGFARGDFSRPGFSRPEFNRPEFSRPDFTQTDIARDVDRVLDLAQRQLDEAIELNESLAPFAFAAWAPTDDEGPRAA